MFSKTSKHSSENLPTSVPFFRHDTVPRPLAPKKAAASAVLIKAKKSPLHCSMLPSAD